MYKLLIDETGRALSMSLIGFDDVRNGCRTIEIDGDMPDFGEPLCDYVFRDSGYVYDPLPEDDVPMAPQPTNEEIMDAVIELAGIVAGMMEGTENG